MLEIGEALTANELSALLPDVPKGTIGSVLSKVSRDGRVRVVNLAERPRRYHLNNGWEPEEAQEVEVVARDPWAIVQEQWRVVFNVSVTRDDARLMTELAMRAVRN